MMADGGTGKTILCCGIAAAISIGKPLPGEVVQGGRQRENSAEKAGTIRRGFG